MLLNELDSFRNTFPEMGRKAKQQRNQVRKSECETPNFLHLCSLYTLSFKNGERVFSPSLLSNRSRDSRNQAFSDWENQVPGQIIFRGEDESSGILSYKSPARTASSSSMRSGRSRFFPNLNRSMSRSSRAASRRGPLAPSLLCTAFKNSIFASSNRFRR